MRLVSENFSFAVNLTSINKTVLKETKSSFDRQPLASATASTIAVIGKASFTIEPNELFYIETTSLNRKTLTPNPPAKLKLEVFNPSTNTSIGGPFWHLLPSPIKHYLPGFGPKFPDLRTATSLRVVIDFFNAEQMNGEDVTGLVPLCRQIFYLNVKSQVQVPPVPSLSTVDPSLKRMSDLEESSIFELKPPGYSPYKFTARLSDGTKSLPLSNVEESLRILHPQYPSNPTLDLFGTVTAKPGTKYGIYCVSESPTNPNASLEAEIRDPRTDALLTTINYVSVKPASVVPMTEIPLENGHIPLCFPNYPTTIVVSLFKSTITEVYDAPTVLFFPENNFEGEEETIVPKVLSTKRNTVRKDPIPFTRFIFSFNPDLTEEPDLDLSELVFGSSSTKRVRVDPENKENPMDCSKNT